MKKNIERAESMVKKLAGKVEEAKANNPGWGCAEVFRPDPKNFTLDEDARVLFINGDYVVVAR